MQNESLAAEHDNLILEGIVVTVNAAGEPNIAPMGPHVDRTITQLTLRPFRTSQTFQNLKATGCGVFHVTDDVELLAHAAVGQLEPPPTLTPMEGFGSPRLADACRWFAFMVTKVEDASERATIECRIVERGELRPFFGFNRAKHAVVETSILATRIGIIPNQEIQREINRLAIVVQKTAGIQERRAFEFLRKHIDLHLTSES